MQTILKLIFKRLNKNPYIQAWKAAESLAEWNAYLDNDGIGR